MDFSLELVEERVKPHQVTSLHMIAALMLLGAGGLAFLIRLKAPAMPIPGFMVVSAATWCILTGMAILAVVIFRNKWLLTPSVNYLFRVGELVLLIATAFIFALFQWWVPASLCAIVSVTLVFSLFWEKGSGRRQFVKFNENGIRLPVNSRRKFLKWSEVDRVILRFGVLTIDDQDNHLLQWNVQPADFDAQDFEAWCISMIEAGKANRIESNW